MQETATLLEGAQLSANRFYCCGITDNPGRFDSKSTQVTRTLRRTDESRKEREKPGGEGRERERRAGGNKGEKKREIWKIKSCEATMCHWLSKYICVCVRLCTLHCDVAVNDVNDHT